MIRCLTIATLLAGAASGAAAQSLPDWIRVDGRLALGYSDRVPGADGFLVGDALLQFNFGGVGSGLPLGFDLGVYGRADALDTPHETYGALTWNFSDTARLSLGVPRPAYDSFAVSAVELHFPSLGVDRAISTRSEATYGAMFNNYLPYGVRFENSTGGFRYATSIHTTDTPDRTIASFGIGTELGNWTVEGAVEAGFGGTTDVSGKLQARTQIGRFSGGAGLYAPATGTGPELIEGFASYSPIDRLTLSGVVQVPLSGGSDPTVGLAGRYSLHENAAISAGVISDAGADASLNAFVDFRF